MRVGDKRTPPELPLSVWTCPRYTDSYCIEPALDLAGQVVEHHVSAGEGLVLHPRIAPAGEDVLERTRKKLSSHP